MIRYDHVPTTPVLTALLLLVVLCGACTRPPPLDRGVLLTDLDPEAQRLSTNGQLEQAMLAMADSLATVGKPSDAMQVLALLSENLSDASGRQVALDHARSLIMRLTANELKDLSARLASTQLNGLLQEELEQRGLVAAVLPPRSAEPGHLGVLTPLTGRYARFGNAFLAGVQLAAEAVLPPQGQIWRIRHEDTEGDVVAAALAARRLVDIKGCKVLLGALLSTTTATAALMADRLGVPLISPTATHERLGMLSDMVLQTNQTGPVEAEILARLACEVLLKERFAIIRSDTPGGLNLAEVFTSCVTGYGGSVVHEEIFDPAATDFRLQVERLRAARPEVVFVQASVDQMIFLGPQLDFFRVGALIFGTSEWNNSRLLQHAGSVMERAVFPAGEMLYPAFWSTSFEEKWSADQHDEEATRIARSAYLAARLVLQAMAIRGADDPRLLFSHLHAGFSGRSVELNAAETFSASIRTIENEQIVPFPGYLYAEALRRQAQVHDEAASDALIDPPAYPSIGTPSGSQGETGSDGQVLREAAGTP